MSDAVSISFKYSADWQGLAHGIARELGCATYFFSGEEFALPLPNDRLIGIDGIGYSYLGPTAPLWEDTAWAPYEFKLSIEFRGGGDPARWDEIEERLGRAMFDRLTALGVPMLYSRDSALTVVADFLPGRGVRDFAPGTSGEEAGYAAWYEPALYDEPKSPWPREVATLTTPPTAPVLVFATGILVHAVAAGWDGAAWRWAVPAASAFTTIGPAGVGRLVGYTQRDPALPPADIGPRILASFANRSELSTEDFGSRAVAIDLRVEGADLVAVPHRRADGPGQLMGPVVDDLVRRVPGLIGPDALGQLVLDLVQAVAG